MLRKSLLVSMSVGLMALLFAPSARAAPIVNATVLDLGNGTWEYAYSLVNPAASTENVFDFGIYFDGTPVQNSVVSPGGWTSISGLGFIDWFSLIDPNLGPIYDLGVGQTLGGFSFVSAVAPGTITFSSLGVDAVTGQVGVTQYGQTTGPQAVPEPGSLLLMAGGLITLIARKRGFKIQG